MVSGGGRWGITVAGELAIVYTGLHGFFALSLTVLPALVALADFAAGLREFSV